MRRKGQSREAVSGSWRMERRPEPILERTGWGGKRWEGAHSRERQQQEDRARFGSRGTPAQQSDGIRFLQRRYVWSERWTA